MPVTGMPAGDTRIIQAKPERQAGQAELKKNPRKAFANRGSSVFFAFFYSGSDGTDVFRLRAFLAFTNRKFYLLPFFEGFAAFHFNGTVVNEHITVAFASDETVTFFVIEPLNSAYHFF